VRAAGGAGQESLRRTVAGASLAAEAPRSEARRVRTQQGPELGAAWASVHDIALTFDDGP